MKALLPATIIIAAAAALACSHGAPDAKGAYATPEAAAEDPDFAIQGEYVGSYSHSDGSSTKVGVQVIALGEGKFRAVGYEGGLPGDGWDGGERQESEAARAADGSVTFVKKEGGSSAVVKDGSLTILAGDKALGTLQRVGRESPTAGAKAPDGAVVLFDGSSLDALRPGARKTDDGLLMEGVHSARKDFKDFHLHLEFRLPYKPKARGQGRGNSGLYLLGTEVQMLDSFGLAGESNECGGLYKWRRPDVNMCYPPLRWQTYDIDYTAAKDGKRGRITVKHNGVVIHNDVELKNNAAQGELHLQNHGNPVRYRNFWLVEK